MRGDVPAPVALGGSHGNSLPIQRLSRGPAEGAGSGPQKEHRPLTFKELIGWDRPGGDHHPKPPHPSMGGSKRQGETGAWRAQGSRKRRGGSRRRLGLEGA